MQHNISKLCADSLRTFSKEQYDIKLKPAHAHELVAAFFGYKSKNAMLSDTKYPFNNLNQADIFVMTTDALIDERRKNLQELSPELPDSYTLGEAVYTALFSDLWWSSEYPPFRSFEKLAKYLVENNPAYQNAFKFYSDVPVHHIVDVKISDSGVLLTVLHSHQISSGELIGDGQTVINLPRVAGHIGYGNPQVSFELWSGAARRTLDANEISFLEVLRKTIEREAESFKALSGLSDSQALDTISQGYGFNHWEHVCELEKYVLLSFSNDDRPVINSPIFDLLIERGFLRVNQRAKIGSYIINQRFPPLTGVSKDDFFKDWKFDVYFKKKSEGFFNLDDIKYFVQEELNLTDFTFVFDGQFYDQDSFLEDYVSEYAYVGNEETY